jgi:long-chain fatty acid transport protein
MIHCGATAALAAEGYFLIGAGARQKALAGADTADSKDAMALAVNPAGIVGLERQFQFAITAAMPERGYSATGAPVVLAPGDARSGRPIFPIPNSAYVSPIDAESSWGFASWGNGGINTSYDIGHFKGPITATVGPFSGPVAPTFGGPFGGGFAGFDLQQEFVSVAYARRYGPISIGVAPTLAAQRVNVQGLKLFSYLSSDPYSLTDDGYDYSFGGGVRVGVEWRVDNHLRLAFAGSTPLLMTPFEKYRGLFANHGNFDIPANITAGVAFDITPELTIMADWRHIFYSGIPTLANPSFPLFPFSLGSNNGPGFDWRDTDAEAVGVEWRATPALTLRAGYLHTSNAIKSRGATVAALAPAVVAHHLGGGFQYQVTKNSSIDVAVNYDFKNSVSFAENDPYAVAFFPAPLGPRAIQPRFNPNSTITAWARAVAVTVGYNYKFDVGDASWFPSHF